MNEGCFDDTHVKLNEYASDIDDWIVTDLTFDRTYTERTIKELRKCAELLRRTALYLKNTDGLLCGEVREVDFHKKIKQDIKKLEKEFDY